MGVPPVAGHRQLLNISSTICSVKLWLAVVMYADQAPATHPTNRSL
jgi:hypothetical protein